MIDLLYHVLIFNFKYKVVCYTGLNVLSQNIILPEQKFAVAMERSLVKY